MNNICPDQLLVNHTASSRYRISGGVLMQLNYLQEGILETFERGNKLSFICAVEGGKCSPWHGVLGLWVHDTFHVFLGEMIYKHYTVFNGDVR